MRTLTPHRLIVVLGIFMGFVASGCTLKASTETLTDATTNFVSSTTPGAWFDGDGLLRQDQRINVFVAMNYGSLQQDMAKGDGEYLSALATLLEIPEAHIPQFKKWSQEQFRLTHGMDNANQQTLLALLLENPGEPDRH